MAFVEPEVGFVPRDPDYAARVRRSFEGQSMMATIGATLERVEPGLVEIALRPAPHILQQHGFVHGGVTTTLGDTAAGFAAMSLMPPGVGILTVEFKVNLLAPAKGERLVGIGRVVRPGRILTICQAEIVAEDGSRRTPIAILTATLMIIEARADVRD